MGILESAVGPGLFAFPGIPPALPVTLQIDALEDDDTARLTVGPLDLRAIGYHEATWTPCEDPPCVACTGGGGRVVPDAPGWLLAVRVDN